MMVAYEGERFIGKEMKEAVNRNVPVGCLEKP